MRTLPLLHVFVLFGLTPLSLPAGTGELPVALNPAVPGSTPTVPAAVDLQPAFEKWGLEARRQGKRPTCSVFVLTGALEFAIARERERGELLSVEFLNWAANQAGSRAGDGGCFSDLWKGFLAHGICAESEMPYRDEFDRAVSPATNAIASAKTALGLGLQLQWLKEWDVRTGLTDAQFLSIKRTLEQGWPVCGGLRWPKQEKWEDNVLQLCPPEAVRDGHSILLVGYRDDPGQPGGGVFIFRNSSRGGRVGCMPYAYAQAYMNDAAWIRARTGQK